MHKSIQDSNVWGGMEMIPYDESLSSISLSRTSKGYLKKWDYFKDGKKYFVKTGEYSYGEHSDNQPLSEYVASELGRQMGFNCIETFLAKTSVANQDGEIKDNVLVSYTEDFLGGDESFISIIKLLSKSDLRSPSLYKTVTEKFPSYKSKIDEMILFDYLINNGDRHLNNFGFIFKDGEIKDFSILFDHGASFFSDLEFITDEIIAYPLKYDRDSKCKPFRSKHDRQVELIDYSIIANYNLDVDLSEILSRVGVIGKRKCVIMSMFDRRLSRVRDLLCKVQG